MRNTAHRLCVLFAYCLLSLCGETVSVALFCAGGFGIPQYIR